MNAICLCAGIGGIELGLSLAIPEITPVCFVESDPFCQRVLQQRHPHAAIWDDVSTWPAADWHGADILTAGFPCQPWSCAGKREGTADDRWLWPRIAECVRLVGPRFVCVENVSGFLAGGIGHVLGDLAALRYDVAWGVFSCADMGASQRRERVFVLAHSSNSAGSDKTPRLQKEFGTSSKHLADAHSPDLREQSITFSGSVDPIEPGRIGQAVSPVWPPGPTDEWGSVSPEFWPVECQLRGVADGIPTRMERAERRARLKALGNSVSPPVAAAAWVELFERLCGQ